MCHRLLLIVFTGTYFHNYFFYRWAIRHVTFPALDDGRSLLITTVLSLVSTSVISAVVALYPQYVQLPVYMSSALAWLTTTVALSAAFLQKVCI